MSIEKSINDRQKCLHVCKQILIYLRVGIVLLRRQCTSLCKLSMYLAKPIGA